MAPRRGPQPREERHEADGFVRGSGGVGVLRPDPVGPGLRARGRRPRGRGGGAGGGRRCRPRGVAGVSHRGAAIGRGGAVSGGYRGGVAVGPYGAAAGGSRGVVAAGPGGTVAARRGTYYVSGAALRTQGTYVRTGFVLLHVDQVD